MQLYQGTCTDTKAWEWGGEFGPKELLFLPRCNDPAAKGSSCGLALPKASSERVQ